MTPAKFPQANTHFRPPAGWDESQIQPVAAYVGTMSGGNNDGAEVVITAWQPSPDELARLNEGGPVFLCFLGGLPPHIVTTDFPG